MLNNIFRQQHNLPARDENQCAMVSKIGCPGSVTDTLCYRRPTHVWAHLIVLFHDQVKKLVSIIIDFNFHFNLRTWKTGKPVSKYKFPPKSIHLYLRKYCGWDIVEQNARRGASHWLFLEKSVSLWDKGLKPHVLLCKLLLAGGPARPPLAQGICLYT